MCTVHNNLMSTASTPKFPRIPLGGSDYSLPYIRVDSSDNVQYVQREKSTFGIVPTQSFTQATFNVFLTVVGLGILSL